MENLNKILKMNTQNIKKEDLKILYDNVCDNWKKQITDLVLWNSNDVIQVQESLIQKAYLEASETQKLLLNKFFTFKNNNIIDRIKTMDDVWEYHKLNPVNILPYTESNLIKLTKKQISANAFVKIQYLSQALNEGIEMEFNDLKEYKYYPWFEKKAHGGWVFDCSDDHCFVGNLGFGSYYKTKKLSDYAGTQFLDIYKEFLPE